MAVVSPFWPLFARGSRSGAPVYLHDNRTCCRTVTCREGELVQDVIRDVCCSLDIPPMARNFFALCTREKGIPSHPLNPYSRLSRQESKKQYQLRVFVNVENSNYLLPVSGAAHDYYYKQLHNDFSEDYLQPRLTINSTVWMAAIDMAREAKQRNKMFEDLQDEIHKFMPDFLHKRYKKDTRMKEKFKEAFDRFHELSVDNSHYINKFLEVYEKDKMCGRHIFPLKQSRVLSPVRANPVQLIVISWKDGIYKTVAGEKSDRKELVCSIADITALKANFDIVQLTISYDTSDFNSDTTLCFADQRHLVAFSVVVQAYWRLKVDSSSIILSGDLAPPDECIKIGKSDRTLLYHGPISQASVEHILSKLNLEEGHFLVRESPTIDNAYTLSVCYNKKVMHYKIICNEDGTYSLRDPDETKGDTYGILEQGTQSHEYERFPTLHDLLKNYHRKADGLPTTLKLNISPKVAGKIPLLPPKNHPGSLTPSSLDTKGTCLCSISPSTSEELLPIDDNRSESSSLGYFSYISTASCISSDPPTPTKNHPAVQLSLVSEVKVAPPEELPKPQNEYILELYHKDVPFIRYKDLKIISKLGQGHFSKVFRAQMKDTNGEERTVAVKIPEVNFDNSTNAEAAKKDLAKEMLTMYSLHHINIVKFVSISETPHYLDYIGLLPVMILEFVPGGSLRGYLDKKWATITADQMSRSKIIFLDIGQQIAEGMKYLEERRVVHRDLAARSVLMMDETHVKISNFGLSRIKQKYYGTRADQASRSGLPIFWYAPECLLSLKFTTQGDIWSYGTTLWEIFTFGDNPSTHLHPIVATANRQHPHKVLAELYKQGRRLPRGNCSMNVMQIILNCWSYAPTARPSFDELATKLRELLHSLQRQERETAPQRLQQDNCYMPMERTMSSITNDLQKSGWFSETEKNVQVPFLQHDDSAQLPGCRFSEPGYIPYPHRQVDCARESSSFSEAEENTQVHFQDDSAEQSDWFIETEKDGQVPFLLQDDCAQQSDWFSEAKKNAQVPFLHHQVLECGYDGMQHTIEEHDITLRIPEGAVAKGEKLHIEIGVAMYGPFIFPENTRPISPILWLCIVKEDNVALKKDFQIILPHFLVGIASEKLHYHQVGFAKAGHNQKYTSTLKHDQIMYEFKVCKTPTLFASSGGKSYGILRSDHCCFYCLQAKKSPELAKNAGYCLARIESSSSVSSEIFFVASFFLSSCVKAWKEQFPKDEGYRYSHCVNFKFKTGEDTEPRIKILPLKQDQFDIAMNPSIAEISESEIDFWNEDIKFNMEMMSLKHDMKMYPPRIKMIAMAKCHNCIILPVKITGCSREGQLDMDLTIGLQSASPSPSSSAGSMSALLESCSKFIATQDEKPELRKALKELLPLAAHWKTIGGLLGIEKDVLDKIQRDEVGVNDCLHDMLAKWHKQTDHPPAWRDIADAIEVIDEQRAQTLRQRLAS